MIGCKPDAEKHPGAFYQSAENLLIQGDLNAAHKKAQYATALFSKQNAAVWAWRFRLLDARVLLREGKNEEVLSMLSEQPPVSLRDVDITLERTVLQAWANVSLGHSEEANRAMKQADILSHNDQLFQANHPWSLTSQAFNAWGALYVQQSNLDRADSVFHRVLQSSLTQSNLYQFALAQLNLSFVALQREHFDEALEWARSAVQSAEKINARSLLEEARGNIAWANYKLGNFEEALSGFKDAEQGAKAVGEIADRMEWLNNTGLSLYRLGHLKEAEPYYTTTLQIAESYHDAEMTIAAHMALAELLLQLDEIAQAEQHANKALDLAHSSGRIQDAMNVLFLKGLIASHRKQFDVSLQTLKSLEADATMTPSLRWQVEGELANQYAGLNQVDTADKWYRQSIVTFESQRKTLKSDESRLPFSNNADQLYNGYIHFLVHHNRTDDALQWLDLGRARTLEEGLGIASPGFGLTLQHRVATGTTARRLHGTILVYHLAPDESYLWAINHSGTHFFTLPGAAEINEHVKNYQRAILDSKDAVTDAYADGMALYKILVEPAQSLIPKDASVYIIPDGSLTTLNFETLLAPSGGLHYWIEDATITDASSLKLLASFHPNAHRKTEKKLLLIGNPISPDEHYPDLPNASGEIAGVSKHFPAGEESIFTRQQALPSAYQGSHPAQFSYIHFVAHGTSSSASPLDSAIVLTRSPANPDAFKLYARDVIRHPLHADLVTVSACYGSGSQTYGGEGLIGLSWAFLRAGAHYVVGSLWQVSDAAAPQLMDHLYDGLTSDNNPAAALREAKLMLLHSHSIYRKPLYWATFQIYGGS